MSDALEVTTTTHRGRQEQVARVNTGKLEELQVLHGLVEPKLNSLEEAHELAVKLGPAWRKIVETIDEISGIDKAAIEKSTATFQPGGEGEGRPELANGASGGSGRPDLPARVGA
jgi:hypothetical protein